jgi:hypothetical protein
MTIALFSLFDFFFLSSDACSSSSSSRLHALTTALQQKCRQKPDGQPTPPRVVEEANGAGDL